MELKKYRLGDIAKVEISGIDKKSKEGQQDVLLCNFVDVYYNWAVTKDNESKFMPATASDSEIESFTLHKGQVAITKDSETRDDIGVATYIADDFDNLVVLGYHTALITPDEEQLCGKYLNALMHSSYFQRYWSNNASGSGQRYTLSQKVIEDAPVYLPDIDIQREIGEFFSDLDKKLCLNKKENDILEAMAKQIYDYWFVQFDFPDTNGRPYKTSGGKMVWNETLKREIPEGWEVKSLSELSDNEMCSIMPTSKPDIVFKHFSIPAYDACGFYEEELGKNILSNKNVVTEHDVLVSKLNPWTSRVIWGIDDPDAICSTEYVSLRPKSSDEKAYMFMIAKSLPFMKYCTEASTGTSHSHRRVNPDILRMYKVPYSRNCVKAFCDMTEEFFNRITINKTAEKELREQRDFILPLLMTGQVSIG